MFELSYRPLCDSRPEWGDVSLLPWDAATFGFGVGDYRIGDSQVLSREIEDFQTCLKAWASENSVEVLVCTVDTARRSLLALLPRMQFACFDHTYTIYLPRLQSVAFPEPRLPIREPAPEDREAIERIAEQVFHFGRYHADPYIPKDLANDRYSKWLGTAFAGLSDKSRMYVTGEIGAVRGFCHANFDGDTGHVTIFAVDRQYQRGITAYYLLAGALDDMKHRGLKKADSKISADNIGMLNLAASFGVRCARPQAVYYWHAPNASHLLHENSFESVRD